MSQRTLFWLVGLLALAAGGALWLVSRPADPNAPAVPGIAPAALYATSFTDAEGRTQPLGQFQGRLLVLNFWATWCTPCREEMPAFARIHAKWKDRGVQLVGVSAEEPDKVAQFGRGLSIPYPLWTGGDQVRELSRRLGNPTGALPHTVLVGPKGEILEMRVGPYTEADLESRLAYFRAKSG